jgi:hypothetical protein
MMVSISQLSSEGSPALLLLLLIGVWLMTNLCINTMCMINSLPSSMIASIFTRAFA